jgi:hypothetical protein
MWGVAELYCGVQFGVSEGGVLRDEVDVDDVSREDIRCPVKNWCRKW